MIARGCSWFWWALRVSRNAVDVRWPPYTLHHERAHVRLIRALGPP